MWARTDDHFYTNPKNATIDRDEQDLFFAGNVYCNLNLTDGFIPAGALPQLLVWAKIPIEANPQAIGEAIASRLLQHGYWEPAAGGYTVHDFLQWNICKADAQELRRVRSEAGKRGGQRSGETRRSKRSKPEANAQANSEANAQANLKQNGTPNPLTTTRTTEEVFCDIRGGAINALDVEQLDDLIREYGDERVMEALKTANKGKAQEFLKLSYVQAILEGRGQQRAHNGNGHTARAEPEERHYRTDVPEAPEPPVTPECERLWRRIVDHLSLQMTKATAEGFIGSRCIADTDDVLTVTVRNWMVRDMFDKRLGEKIRQAARDVSGRPGLDVCFETSLELAA